MVIFIAARKKAAVQKEIPVTPRDCLMADTRGLRGLYLARQPFCIKEALGIGRGCLTEIFIMKALSA